MSPFLPTFSLVSKTNKFLTSRPSVGLRMSLWESNREQVSEVEHGHFAAVAAVVLATLSLSGAPRCMRRS
jgi:hypothetical protein